MTGGLIANIYRYISGLQGCRSIKRGVAKYSMKKAQFLVPSTCCKRGQI